MVFVDAAVTRSVAHLPRWVVSAFHEITEFGKSGWFLWPLGVLFLVLAALPPVLTPFSQRVLATVMVRVGFLFTAITVPSLFVTIVKRLIGRARPYVGGSLDPLLFDPFKWVPAYAGMPSGHATTAFAVMVAFGTLWPRARTILLVYAMLIVVSRVVVIAHYPSDVLAGSNTMSQAPARTFPYCGPSPGHPAANGLGPDTTRKSFTLYAARPQPPPTAHPAAAKRSPSAPNLPPRRPWISSRTLPGSRP